MDENSVQSWDPGEFVGGRVRLQRVRDARFFTGWLESAAGDLVSVASTEPLPAEQGDEFSIHLYGRCHEALMAARFVGSHAEPRRMPGHPFVARGTLRKEGRIQLLPSTEAARFIAEGACATISYADQILPTSVLDYSSHGISVVSERQLPVRFTVDVLLFFSGARIDCVASVCYSRPLADGTFRSGLRLVRFRGTSEQTWTHLSSQESGRRAA